MASEKMEQTSQLSGKLPFAMMLLSKMEKNDGCEGWILFETIDWKE